MLIDSANFEKKNILITGGANGIGKAVATALARRGANIVIADINQVKAENVAQLLVKEFGITAYALKVDVTLRISVQEMYKNMFNLFDVLDCLVANAGISTMNQAINLTDEEWDFNFDVNTRGIFLTNQIIARKWIESNYKGVIVNTASLAAKVGAPLLAHYSASKFAVLGWTQAVAREWAVYGIRVNAVCPGFVKTGMQEREVEWEAAFRNMTTKEVIDDYISQTPLGRLETPEDVANVVAFLLSEASTFMTGQGVNVTGGVYMG